MRLTLILLLLYLAVLLALTTSTSVWIAMLPIPFVAGRKWERITAGTTLGVLLDAASGVPPGAVTASMLLTLTLSERFRDRFADTVTVRGSLAFGAAMVALLLVGLFRAIGIVAVAPEGIVPMSAMVLQPMTLAAFAVAFLAALLIRPKEGKHMLRL